MLEPDPSVMAALLPSEESDQHAREVMKAIRRIIRAIDLRSRKVSGATGLTIPQLVILQGIRELGEVTSGALSSFADLSPATVTTILDNLQARGLVERYRSATDRRIVHARPTEHGLEVLGRALPMLNAAFTDELSSLPALERRHLLDALGRIASMLENSARAVER
jgi:DNA-binding MarR family transcriptional regulator